MACEEEKSLEVLLSKGIPQVLRVFDQNQVKSSGGGFLAEQALPQGAHLPGSHLSDSSGLISSFIIHFPIHINILEQSTAGSWFFYRLIFYSRVAISFPPVIMLILYQFSSCSLVLNLRVLDFIFLLLISCITPWGLFNVSIYKHLRTSIVSFFKIL